MSVSVYDGAIPMLSAVPSLIQTHPLIPPEKRSRYTALTRKVIRWFERCANYGESGSDTLVPRAELIPFTRTNLGLAFERLSVAQLDITPKSVANTLGICNQIADALGMPSGYAFAPLSPECQELQDTLARREDRGSCIRIFRVMSAHGLHPDQVRLAVPHLRAQIDSDWRVKNKDNRSHYAWNHSVRRLPGWPQILLELPRLRKVWGLRWRELAELESSTDACLSLGDPRPEGEDLFAGPAAAPLRDATKRGRKEAVRMAGSTWRHIEALKTRTPKTVREICLPDNFRNEFRVLSKRAGGVNRTIIRYARDIWKLGQGPGILEPDELKALKADVQILEARHREFLKTHEDRDQKLLDRLDDPSAMDAYLTLAHREAQAALRPPARLTVGNAYKIERALTLEFWHTMPWRISATVAIRVDQIVEVEVDGEKRMMLRAPKDQAGNKRSPDQFLSPEAATLLRIFLDKYRPILLRHNKAEDSPYLFPGAGGRMRHPHTLRVQMNRFVRRLGLDFHPHAVRKITPKVILDEDPTAIGIAVRSGGWADDRMLRKVYGQKNHRRSQLKINEFVQGRRLRAMATLRTPKKDNGRNSKKRAKAS